MAKKDIDKWKIEDFKPFMPCLARQADGELWFPMFFGRYPSNIPHALYAAVSRHCWSQCIPYEGNEHLYMTSDDCDAKYKTWEV